MSRIPLLESESEIEVAGLYFHSVRQFGKSLGQLVDEKFRSKDAANWFEIVKRERKDEKGAVYDDPFDPRFLIKEAVISDSPVALAIPGFNKEWRDLAFKLKSQINKWSHFSVSPTVSNLIVVFENLLLASKLSNLDIAGDFETSIARLKEIESGDWKLKRAPDAVLNVDDAAKSFVQEISRKSQESQRRPPVGSEWTGAKGTRKIVINKSLRDVTENGVSIKSSLGSNADEIVTQWLRYFPLGGEAKVAPDGAVMGFRKGTPYLIGWVGIQQEEEIEPQGFFLDHGYQFTGDDIRDIETGELLSEVAREPIDWIIRAISAAMKEETVFNVTTYGQIVTEGINGEAVKILDVHKNVWFPGQLPE